mmetsp:Transcript_23076/g.37332  ORF Transcript_23076/g.37332 Transcript_23076/m.37332 type:complete len:469 (-) Transcript_23076:116-1522(-)
MPVFIQGVLNRGDYDFGHYDLLLVLEIQRITQASKVPKYYSLMPVDSYTETGEQFGILNTDDTLNGDDGEAEEDGGATGDQTDLLKDYAELVSDEERDVFAEEALTPQQLAELYDASLESSVARTSTIAAKEMAAKVGADIECINPEQLSRAEKKFFSYLIPFHLTEGSLDKVAFVSTWNKQAASILSEYENSSKPTIRLFTVGLLSRYWEKVKTSINIKMSYRQIKEADEAFKRELQQNSRQRSFQAPMDPDKTPFAAARLQQCSPPSPSALSSGPPSVAGCADDDDLSSAGGGDDERADSEKESDCSVAMVTESTAVTLEPTNISTNFHHQQDEGKDEVEGETGNDDDLSAFSKKTGARRRKPQMCKKCGHAKYGANNKCHVKVTYFDAETSTYKMKMDCNCISPNTNEDDGDSEGGLPNKKKRKRAPQICSVCNNPKYDPQYIMFHMTPPPNSIFTKCSFPGVTI